jgi:hypothetical protein
MDEDEIIDSANSVSLEDVAENDFNDPKAGTIVGFVESRFKRAEDARYIDEQRWIRAYRNYRGIYGPDVQFTSTEKSKIFVKVTKTKTLAAYGQIVDVLFGANRFPITIDPTTLPEGITEAVHFETNPQMDAAA